ncbi:MAG: hypothetical protein QXU90_00480 [Acidilobaceae archaeon]
MAATAVALAKAKYAAKVCGYLSIAEKSKCEKVFDKLYANMKAVFEAIP